MFNDGRGAYAGIVKTTLLTRRWLSDHGGWQQESLDYLFGGDVLIRLSSTNYMPDGGLLTFGWSRDITSFDAGVEICCK